MSIGSDRDRPTVSVSIGSEPDRARHTVSVYVLTGIGIQSQ